MFSWRIKCLFTEAKDEHEAGGAGKAKAILKNNSKKFLGA